MGKEYITDADIKKDSFKIKEIRISQDLLHKEMIIPTENLNIEQIKDMVKVEMTSRREKLNKVAELLKTFLLFDAMLNFRHILTIWLQSKY